MTRRLFLLPFALCSACISTPPITVVSTQTAVMAQSAGEMPKEEYELTQAGLKPGPEPAPREDLPPGEDTEFQAALRIHRMSEGDWREVDRLQKNACVGEANTALLVSRPEGCQIDVDAAEISRLLGRMNIHRQQLWTALAEERSADADTVRETWREIHLQRVVCGAPVQSSDGSWKAKAC